ncbi:MAG TPA: hypothetical protein VIU15_33055 [Streptomyces sp.]
MRESVPAGLSALAAEGSGVGFAARGEVSDGRRVTRSETLGEGIGAVEGVVSRVSAVDGLGTGETEALGDGGAVGAGVVLAGGASGGDFWGGGEEVDVRGSAISRAAAQVAAVARTVRALRARDLRRREVK